MHALLLDNHFPKVVLRFLEAFFQVGLVALEALYLLIASIYLIIQSLHHFRKIRTKKHSSDRLIHFCVGRSLGDHFARTIGVLDCFLEGLDLHVSLP